MSRAKKILDFVTHTDYLSGRELVDVAKRNSLPVPTKEDCEHESLVFFEIEGVKHITKKSTMKAASRIVDCVRARGRAKQYTLEIPAPSELNDEQRVAWKKIAAGGTIIMTGGPGTGKSFMISKLVAAARSTGAMVDVLAPTGRAAAMLVEKCGAGSTVHSAIGYSNVSNGLARQLYGEIVIVDECSMVDSAMMTSIIGSVKPESTLVLVGDPDQLEPVGGGTPFIDMIGAMPDIVCRLAVSKRQAAGSPIIRAAQQILSGSMPSFAYEFEMHIYDDLIGWAADWYRENGGLVLASTNDLAMSINRAISCRKSPSDGDKIMFTRNNYDIGVENGTFGRIDGDRIVRADGSFVCCTDEEDVEYTFGYCTTVHKAQGGQAKNVLVVVDASRNIDRNLLYTAVTRAEATVDILCRSFAHIERAIKEARPSKRAILQHLLSVKEVEVDYE